MASSLLSLASLLHGTTVYDPQTVSLDAPPALTGVLDATTNGWLAKARQYADKLVDGPESMVVVDNYVYTGLSNGWIVEIQPSTRNGRVRKILRMSTSACMSKPSERSCGRPLGLRVDPWGYLVVVDPYKGIFRVDPRNGVKGRANSFERLVDPNTLVNSRPLGYISDLTVAKDGTIFFTSASERWTHAEENNILLEGETTGRVLLYDPSEADPKKRVQELVTNLCFPDGIQLSKDESYLLVAERGRARIHKVFVDDTLRGSNLGTFADNLPGFVDNIRLSPRGTYWVGLAAVRHKDAPSLLDLYGNQTSKRRELMESPPKDPKLSSEPRHAMALELDDKGQIIRSLHDQSGLHFSRVSEVQEHGGRLFIASPDLDFIGLLRVKDIQEGTVPSANESSSIPSERGFLDQLMTSVDDRLKAMKEEQMRDILINLLMKLYEASMGSRRASEQLSQVENALLQIRAAFNNGLTDHQKQLVRNSWVVYKTGPGILQDTVLMFSRLFKDSPDARLLFPYVPADGASAEALGNNTRFLMVMGRVVEALNAVVTHMDRPAALAQMTRDLGARHAVYGVEVAHLEPIKAGLFDALGRRLGPALTVEARQAWEAVIDMVLTSMKQGLIAARLPG